MASDLPTDPKEREILLRALREYSERCEPPALTPDCPYSFETEPGVRGCAEECMDLLARHNAPRPSEEIDLGGGLFIRRARRPRARRIRDETLLAYDARQVFLEDSGSGPPSRWRMASLLYGLLEAVQRPPPADAVQAAVRREHIKALVGLIEERGLGFSEYVLPSVRVKVAAVLPLYITMCNIDVYMVSDFDQVASWATLADRYLSAAGFQQSEEVTPELFGLLLIPIMHWAQTATPEDLLNWVAPARLVADEQPPIEVINRDSEGMWIIERFTETYLHTWSVPSLTREWQYLHGQLAGPCSPSEMSVRVVSQATLSIEMAERLAAPTPPDPADTSPVHWLVGPAVGLLEEGRRREAAVLFEAVLRCDPDNSDAMNNLGFCLLPDDPKKALELFKAAYEIGGGDIEIIDVNRMLALTAAGRFTSAIDLASAYRERHADAPPRVFTWLWDIDSVLEGDDPAIIRCHNLVAYAEEVEEKTRRRVDRTHRDP